MRSARVMQLEGMFDVPPTERSEERWSVDVPLEARPWAIGLIVGPSGVGKSTLARELFGPSVVTGFDWPADRSLVDGFPSGLSIKDITALLSSVGFSSPPAWLRPFGVLSTGQQFRVTLARALAGGDDLVVVDEFTSVVDRTVAQVGSAAVARSVRALGKRFVAVTCHYDVLEWLQPDWIFEPHLARFQWRALQRRPPIELSIERTAHDIWPLFRGHHYLSADLNPSARCFVARWQGRPVGLTAVLPSAGFIGIWREHRTICLPDFQGVGIGNALSRTVAAITVAANAGARYRSVTGHPAFMRARLRSNDWRMMARPSMSAAAMGTLKGKQGRRRLAATFEYVGAPYADVDTARAMWDQSWNRSKRTTMIAASAARVG